MLTETAPVTVTAPVTKYPEFLVSPKDLDVSIDCVISDLHDAMQAMLKDAQLKIKNRKASCKLASAWPNDGEIIV